MDGGELALIVVAVAAAFFVKGVTGMGGPLVAIPIMAAVMGVERAVVIITVPSFVANVWLLIEHRAGAQDTRHHLGAMLAAGIAGTVLGTWLLIELDDRVLSLTLGLIVVAYVIRFLTNPDFRVPEPVVRVMSMPVGLAAGVLQGATGISGPLVATYVHSLRLAKSSFLFALTAAFQVLGVAQMVSLAAFGRYTQDRMVEAALAIIPAMLVFPLGILVSRRLSPRGFELVVLGILVLTAGRLIVSALTGGAPG